MKMMLYLIIVLLAFFLIGFFISPSEDLYRGFISCRRQAFSNSVFGRTRRSAVSVRAKACSEPTERKADVLASQGSSLVNSTLASFKHQHTARSFAVASFKHTPLKILAALLPTRRSHVLTPY